MYAFSSIHAEMRHKPFKADLKHCFLGGKRKAPARSAVGLKHLLSVDALDKGLQLHSLSHPDSACSSKRRRQ